MKKIIFILCILAFAGITCKKEKDIVNTIPGSNGIYYKDFIPDVIKTVAKNDTVDYYLDVNNDSIYDMHFYMHYGTTVIGHQEVSEFYKSVSGINGLEFFEFSKYCNGPCQPPLDSGVYIKTNSVSGNYLLLECNDWQAFVHCNCFTSKKYIGFKLLKNGHYYLGWVHFSTYNSDLIIDDFATSFIISDSIKVGYH